MCFHVFHGVSFFSFLLFPCFFHFTLFSSFCQESPASCLKSVSIASSHHWAKSVWQSFEIRTMVIYGHLLSIDRSIVLLCIGCRIITDPWRWSHQSATFHPRRNLPTYGCKIPFHLRSHTSSSDHKLLISWCSEPEVRPRKIELLETSRRILTAHRHLMNKAVAWHLLTYLWAMKLVWSSVKFLCLPVQYCIDVLNSEMAEWNHEQDHESESGVDRHWNRFNIFQHWRNIKN